MLHPAHNLSKQCNPWKEGILLHTGIKYNQQRSLTQSLRPEPEQTEIFLIRLNTSLSACQLRKHRAFPNLGPLHCILHMKVWDSWSHNQSRTDREKCSALDTQMPAIKETCDKMWLLWLRWDCPFSLHAGNLWDRASVLTSSVFAGIPKQSSTKQKWCLFSHYRGCRSEIWITALHCGWSENDTSCYGPIFLGELTFSWWYFQLSCSQSEFWIPSILLNPQGLKHSEEGKRPLMGDGERIKRRHNIMHS